MADAAARAQQQLVQSRLRRFRRIANCRDTHGKKKLVLGFCFSFPLEQTARDSGTLIKWVKGYENAGVEGRNVVELLQDAFHRKVCGPESAMYHSMVPARLSLTPSRPQLS